MEALAPLPVIVPLLVAALLLALSKVCPRWLSDGAALLTAAAVAAICAVMFVATLHEPIVYWFGGWGPEHGFPLGIAFFIDPLGSVFAGLAALLTTAALLFAWHSFKAVHTLFHGLMLIFLAGMAGFCLTGDLFNLFVFFELMSVAGFSLTGYKTEETGPLQGALNFAVVNSLGGIILLAGVAMLYAHTGALNIAQIGATLGSTPAAGVVIVSFCLMVTGLLVKAAVVPFHFWLPDAHATAPIPVSVLLSGVMVQVWLYGVASLYWPIFHASFSGHRHVVTVVLLAAGTASGVLGAIMCFAQRHLKRLLAFSTISHVGLLVIGMGLLTAEGLAAASVYLLGHGLVKASLFMGVGVLLHRYGSVDEAELAARGRNLWPTAVLFVIAGFALAGAPPFGVFLGKSMLEDAGRHAGYPWFVWLATFVSVVTAGAVLRVAARIFTTWCGKQDVPDAPARGDEQPDTRQRKGSTPRTMLAAIGLLLVAALAVGLARPMVTQIEEAATRFTTQGYYIDSVLHSKYARPPHSERHFQVQPSHVLLAMASVAGAILLAAASLAIHRAPSLLRAAARAALDPPLQLLRAIHSGYVGDYVAWLVLGVAAMTAAMLLGMR